ncbi:hypothetical protein FLJC2902T_28480 [Flavobacterium limnosediminis JC2902]|uniref:Uncharacterized protein n=1 Tax=Flavobacterium limnosediminis JC2902 TaxID=1341181 RepID=V6SI41_9FLAO|nr:hypothetical protein FLJC2902T_28480 [Flavobacterium limnosediminis JC2902]
MSSKRKTIFKMIACTIYASVIVGIISFLFTVNHNEKHPRSFIV